MNEKNVGYTCNKHHFRKTNTKQHTEMNNAPLTNPNKETPESYNKSATMIPDPSPTTQ